ncbi:hypothetical protein FYJ24_08065 [Actinomycetaceae bacterium WB03_NA08]|uniref:Uncharacterized protein n=1 Tax=Scrofimicrobium canadense TaxID=2652290 RepID=A0A6N7VSE9_9ACTO|nr:hypothetical protein [Scrofimicrobium canadense]MSS84717.1 hypothetical protein [Scrofimicrobium canadense]
MKQPNSEDDESMASQVQRLTDELEAARLERDKYKAANKTMSAALAQMDELLQGKKRSGGKQGDNAPGQ